jgi:hypothetical protein
MVAVAFACNSGWEWTRFGTRSKSLLRVANSSSAKDASPDAALAFLILPGLLRNPLVDHIGITENGWDRRRIIAAPESGYPAPTR